MKEALRGYIIDQVPYPKEEEINDILALFEEKHFKKALIFFLNEYSSQALVIITRVFTLNPPVHVIITWASTPNPPVHVNGEH